MAWEQEWGKEWVLEQLRSQDMQMQARRRSGSAVPLGAQGWERGGSMRQHAHVKSRPVVRSLSSEEEEERERRQLKKGKRKASPVPSDRDQQPPAHCQRWSPESPTAGPSGSKGAPEPSMPGPSPGSRAGLVPVYCCELKNAAIWER